MIVKNLFKPLLLTVILNIYLPVRKQYHYYSPWQHLTVAEAFNTYAPLSLGESLEKDLMDETLSIYIEPKLSWDSPTILHDYPIQLASLAKRKESDQTVAERFELYIGGVELANDFSELIDPDEQRQCFIIERKNIISSGGSPCPMPEKFMMTLKKNCHPVLV